MTAIIRFRSLYGTQEDEPLCQVLEVDDFTFLLDCGWTSQFDTQILEPLKKYLQNRSFLLIILF
jgi:cleavage and polyadenylation specificity factor subunit 2